jgi:uncharacterized protein (TIGR02444 family)
MAPLEIDNSFWKFSLRVYGSPGVAAECLELQDKHGFDVNVVLFAAWLGASRGIVLEQADLDRIEQAVADWTALVVRPLRAVRQTLKMMPEIADPDVQALRKQVADTELRSEQIEQALLYRLADGFGQPSAAPGDRAARANVVTIFGRRGVDAAAFPLSKLIAASSETVQIRGS